MNRAWWRKTLIFQIFLISGTPVSTVDVYSMTTSNLASLLSYKDQKKEKRYLKFTDLFSMLSVKTGFYSLIC